MFLARPVVAQTLGGNAAYNFLKLPTSPILTAAGGVNVSLQPKEAGFSAHVPSLFTPEQDAQLNTSFNAFIAGIQSYSTTYAFYHSRSQTVFGGHVNFLNYGSVQQTDAAGNISGTFRPVDLALQVSASRSYLQNWRYGASLKFIHSRYQQYTSSAIAADVSVSYFDSAKGLSASLLIANAGGQLSSYSGEREDLPFEVQVGITKRLRGSPLAFSLTLQQLHRFNTVYNDPAFNADNEIEGEDGFATELFNHVVLASHIYISQNLEATIGYNQLRRNELSVANTGNGLTGFSIGLRAKFNRLEVQLARAGYQRNVSYTHFALNLPLNKLFGL